MLKMHHLSCFYELIEQHYFGSLFQFLQFEVIIHYLAYLTHYIF